MGVDLPQQRVCEYEKYVHWIYRNTLYTPTILTDVAGRSLHNVRVNVEKNVEIQMAKDHPMLYIYVRATWNTLVCMLCCRRIDSVHSALKEYYHRKTVQDAFKKVYFQRWN